MTITNPVTGLTVVARYSQIDVGWDPSPGAGQYWVRAKISGRQVAWVTMCGDNSTFVTLHNMDQGTTYTISVWAGPDGPGNNASTTVTTKGPKPGSAMATVSTTVPCPAVPAAPVVTTGAVTGVTDTQATLNATVNPGNLATTAHFNYGPDSTYGSATPLDTSPGSGGSAVPVSAVVTGLTASTTYH